MSEDQNRVIAHSTGNASCGVNGKYWWLLHGGGLVAPGQNEFLGIYPPPEPAAPTPVWSSNDPYVATINQAGVVTAVSPGLAFVSSDYCGAAKGIEIRVVPLRGVSFVPTDGGTVASPTSRATFTVTPADFTTIDGLTLQFGDGFTPFGKRIVPSTGVAVAWPVTVAPGVPDPTGLIPVIRGGVLSISYAGLVSDAEAPRLRMVQEFATDYLVTIAGSTVDPGARTVSARVEQGAYALELVDPYTMITSDSATVQSPDGRARMTIPSRSFVGPFGLPVVLASGYPADPNIVANTAYRFGLGPNTRHESSRPLTVRIAYDPATVPVGAEPTLRMYTLKAGAWRPVVESTVDVTKQVVTAKVGTVGTFALFSNASALPVINSLTLAPVQSMIRTGELSTAFTLVGVTPSGFFVNDPPALWASDDTTIAIATPEGRIAPRSPGTTTIRAVAGAARASAQVTVTLSSVERISAGGLHTCAMTAADGGDDVFCWGSNRSTQTGDGSATDRLSPVAVDGPVHADWIATGFWHSCSVKSDGPTWCWGRNESGQIGRGDHGRDVIRPSKTRTLAAFTSITAGEAHACATVNTATWCWGRNDLGQLGIGVQRVRCGSVACEKDPVRVANPQIFSLVESGNRHVCGLIEGRAWCWGSDGGDYALGMPGTPIERCTSGTTTYNCSIAPRPVASLMLFRTIDAGGNHTCGIERGSDRIFCWGSNGSGEAGIAGTLAVPIPQPIAVNNRFESVSAGKFHTCAVETGTHAIWCWGRNDLGQLGNGTSSVNPLLPTRIPGNLVWESVSVGDLHTCAVERRSVPNESPGRAWCWGANTAGQLGDGTYNRAYSPTKVVGQLP